MAPSGIGVELSPCPDEQESPEVTQVYTEAASLPVHVSSFWAGNFTRGIYEDVQTSGPAVPSEEHQITHVFLMIAWSRQTRPPRRVPMHNCSDQGVAWMVDY